MDPSKSCIFELNIKNDWFDTYEIIDGNEYNIGINAIILSKIFGIHNENQFIVISYDNEVDNILVTFKSDTLFTDFSISSSGKATVITAHAKNNGKLNNANKPAMVKADAIPSGPVSNIAVQQKIAMVCPTAVVRPKVANVVCIAGLLLYIPKAMTENITATTRARHMNDAKVAIINSFE